MGNIQWNIDDIDNKKDRIETPVFPLGILLTIFFTLEEETSIEIDLLRYID